MRRFVVERMLKNNLRWSSPGVGPATHDAEVVATTSRAPDRRGHVSVRVEGAHSSTIWGNRLPHERTWRQPVYEDGRERPRRRGAARHYWRSMRGSANATRSPVHLMLERKRP